jgi:hypothetical protein
MVFITDCNITSDIGHGLTIIISYMLRFIKNGIKTAKIMPFYTLFGQF